MHKVYSRPLVSSPKRFGESVRGKVALHFLCSLKENQAGNFILVLEISFDSK